MTRVLPSFYYAWKRLSFHDQPLPFSTADCLWDCRSRSIALLASDVQYLLIHFACSFSLK
jgi:hypothetical protein